MSYPHLSLGAIRNPPPVLSRATSLRPLGYHNWFKGWLKCVSRGEQVIGNRNHDQRIYGAISYACYKLPEERKYSMDILFEDYPGGGAVEAAARGESDYDRAAEAARSGTHRHARSSPRQLADHG